MMNNPQILHRSGDPRVTPAKPIRILLIEDNYEEAELVHSMLAAARRFYFKFIHEDCLSGGIECLKHIESERTQAARQDEPVGQSECPVDVILLDLFLPDSSGLESFTRINQLSPSVPVILMTNLDDENLALQAVREGAQDYLVKTELDSNLLSRTIKYAIERKRVEESLRESEERYMLASKGANDGLWDWQLKTNQVYFSPRWKNMLGYTEDEIGDRPEEWLNRIHPEDVEDVRVALQAHIKGLSDQFESEHRMQCKDGSYMWVLTRGLAVCGENRLANRMAGSQSDITLRKRTEEQLLHNALYDGLTGLPNRALVMDRLRHSIEYARRHANYQFAVLYLDMDRFKVVNDSLGHAFGDQLLVKIAETLSSFLRAGDSIARLGGDDFLILLDEISQPSDAELVAERILQALILPMELEGRKVVITASIGLVLCDLCYNIPEDILRDAEIAMYHAKLLGKACYAIFNLSMRNRAIARMELENDLRQALENEERLAKELWVEFQPIVLLREDRIVGFEALVRWMHPERGLIKPLEFIPLAEETGLIHSLGIWVLREACKQVSAWKKILPIETEASPLSINVNISGRQLIRPEFVDQIQQAITDFDIHPSTLNLEITESFFLDSDEPFYDTLRKISALGVNLEVDDFGRGYSSFGYLESLPVKSLKIDQAFINRLGVKGNNSEIVRTIVDLARSLGMSVIAEGVETEIQYQKLKELNCPYVQGFFFSKPVSGKVASDLLFNNRSLLV
jgi:diguanylate cyclase (GGDEF)-like protein/PAS domain S-box-containing protein